VIWANSIHLSIFLNTTGHRFVNETDVLNFLSQNIQKFENTMSTNYLQSFNLYIINQKSPDILIGYSFRSVYVLDICQYLNKSDTDCTTLVRSSLMGGYRTYEIFLRDVTMNDKDGVRLANEKYGS
jgi:hypothetical protein